MHISDLKANLRQSISERIGKMTAEQRQAESRSLCRRILPMIPEGSTVCGYYPLKSEADIRPLLLTLLERGDDVYLPSFRDQQLAFRRVTDLTDLPRGELNIPEPEQNAAELNPASADFILVPGRAFDSWGNRLGRGNGGYDKWIAQQREMNAETQFIGVALACQVVRDVPCEEHDQRVDSVMTAQETYITPEPNQ